MARVPYAETKRRLAKLRILVENGKETVPALIEAGYSKSVAARQKHGSKLIQKVIEEGRQKFESDYLLACEKSNLTGKPIAERLSKTIYGKDDFNSTNAIKVHMGFVSKMATNKQGYKQSQGNIIIPITINAPDWNKAGNRSGKVVEAELVKDNTK